MKLLEEMQNIFSPSGEEDLMKEFLINYVKKINIIGKENQKLFLVMIFKIV